jgi:hypothetical protein
VSVVGPTVTPTQLRERGWTRTDPRPWSKLRARWEGPDGWRLEHCGHPTANTPWVLIAPDGRWIRTGARFAEPAAANLGTAWPDLAMATEYVADVRAGTRVLPGPEMDREGDPASNPRKAARRTKRPAAPAARPAAHEARAKRPAAPAKRSAGPAKPPAWPPAGFAPLPSVLGRMAWPDVGTYVAWSEETTERRGRQVRHGTAHLTGRVTRVTVDPVDPRDIDVWAVPSRGEERPVGIAGLFVPEAKIAGFRERAQRVYAAKLEQVQAMLGGGSAYGEAMVASNLRPEDLASAQAWPEDTLGVLTQIQEHQGHGPGTKKWGANHEGLPRATIDRLVKEGLVQEVFMSGKPVTAESPRGHYPTLLVTTEAGDAMLSGESPARASVPAKPEPSRPPGPGSAGPIAAVHEGAAKPPERRAAPRVLGQRHATMAENVNRWASHVESQVNRLTPTDRAKFYEIHAAETLRTAIRAAEVNKVPETERETVARKALASHPALRPFVDHLPPVGSTKRNVPVVLIACAGTKVDTHGQQVPAADLYASPLFRKSLAYARAITTPDNIWILSALHGAIRTDTRIGTYEVAMKDLSVREREEWADGARATIVGALGASRPRRVILLGGEDYRVPLPWPVEEPLKGKLIGPRLRWLNEQLASLGATETAAPTVAPRRRARVRIAASGNPWQDVEALAWDGDLFVNEDVEDPDVLRVTHAPSGRMWNEGYRELASAMAAAATLNLPSIRPTFDRVIRAVLTKDRKNAPRLIQRLRSLLDQHAVPGAPPHPDAPPPSQLSVSLPVAPPSPRPAWGSVLGRPLQPRNVAPTVPPPPRVLWGSVLGRPLKPAVAS